MKKVLIMILPFIVSIAWCQIDYKPISGALLEHWNTTAPSQLPKVYHFDPEKLPDGIYELRIAGIEVERDSLDIYLLGTAVDTDIPFLLATGGYRGNHNFTKSDASYDEDEGLICICFQMPFSARYCKGCYRWDIENESLELIRYINGDPSLEAMERANSLMAEGRIAEAICELDEMFYPDNYYSSDEMIARLLRSINRAAGDAEGEGNFEKAVSLFGDLAGFLHTDREWFTAFTDSVDYVNCNYSEYMGLGEYAMIMNNYAYFLEQTDDLGKSLIVLRKVLDLKPERMVAHINIADVLWALGEPAEAKGHYRIYVNMMINRELTHQIPDYVHERLAQPLAVSEAVEISTGPVEGMEFAHIPSGHFLMGTPSSEDGRDNDEGPQHRVNITAFELMTTEVTQGVWFEVMGTDLRYFRDLLNPEWTLTGDGYYYPMYFISWNDCQKFIAAVNTLDPVHIYRLPSEAEWEYSCRAGTNTPYYWGDLSSLHLVDRYCWHKANSDGTAHPVAQKEANEWGLYDMSGNLSEWCEDAWHDSYSSAPSNGDAWVDRNDSLRAFRCGNWLFNTGNCRSADRNNNSPGDRYNNVGFRVVRVLRTPEMVVKVFLDAYNNSNGYLILACLPAESTEEFLNTTKLFMDDPEAAVTIFASMGIDITAEEVQYLTAGDFFSITLMAEDILPDFSSVTIEIGDAVINGDTAIVPVTGDGNVEEIELFMEDGYWKLVSFPHGML